MSENLLFGLLVCTYMQAANLFLMCFYFLVPHHLDSSNKKKKEKKISLHCDSYVTSQCVFAALRSACCASINVICVQQPETIINRLEKVFTGHLKLTPRKIIKPASYRSAPNNTFIRKKTEKKENHPSIS